MEKIELSAQKREILGKKVRFMRREGITPVHLFGHRVESMALQCNTVELHKALALAGKTKIINLQVDKSRTPRTVMVRETQKNPINGELLHVDLYQIIATEKIKAEIPIVLIGEAPALRSKDNLLEHELTTLSVECLPTDIPDKIEVDVSVLVDDDSAIRVKDLVLAKGVTQLRNPERVVVKIGKQYAERREEVVAGVEAAPVAEAPPAPPAGEQKTE
jgi:large subunit ribosomal protein L25